MRRKNIHTNKKQKQNNNNNDNNNNNNFIKTNKIEKLSTYTVSINNANNNNFEFN
jgi:hypothetical protein